MIEFKVPLARRPLLTISPEIAEAAQKAMKEDLREKCEAVRRAIREDLGLDFPPIEVTRIN